MLCATVAAKREIPPSCFFFSLLILAAVNWIKQVAHHKEEETCRRGRHRSIPTKKNNKRKMRRNREPLPISRQLAHPSRNNNNNIENAGAIENGIIGSSWKRTRKFFYFEDFLSFCFFFCFWRRKEMTAAGRPRYFYRFTCNFFLFFFFLFDGFKWKWKDNERENNNTVCRTIADGLYKTSSLTSRPL